MNIALGKIIYIVLKTLSYLPFWILYGVSDVLFVFVYYVIGYRKKVVMDNLNILFQKKHPKKRRRSLVNFLGILLILLLKASRLLA
jgi:KDO2-lipid IV(A) lauroyltransferase